MLARSDTLEALKALAHASPAAVATWCMQCGRISIVDVEEIVLAAGDPGCPLAPRSGTPQECIDDLSNPAEMTQATVRRLQQELAALDNMLSRPTTNEERSQLLAERQTKAEALDALSKT
jgi:hypothetical protein